MTSFGDLTFQRRCGMRAMPERLRPSCPPAQASGVIKPLSVDDVQQPANRKVKRRHVDPRLDAEEEVGLAEATSPTSSTSYADRYLASFAVKTELPGHFGCVNSIHFNMDGSVLLSGSDDVCLCLYSTRDSWKLLGTVRTLHGANIFDAVFMPLEQTSVLSCALDGRVLRTRLDHSLTAAEDILPIHRSTSGCMASRIATSAAWPHSALVSYDRDMAMWLDVRCSNATSRHKPLQVVPDTRLVRRVNAVCQHPTHPFVVAMGTNTPAVYLCDVRCLSGSVSAEQLVTPPAPGHVRSSCFQVLWTPQAGNSDGIGGLSFSNAGDAIVANYKQADPIIYEWRRVLGMDCATSQLVSGLEGIQCTAGKDERRVDTHHGVPQCPSIVLRGRKNDVTMFKEAIFVLDDTYVCSGGDCGGAFFWRRDTGLLVHRVAGADGSIVNGVLAHDALPEIITCGIDSGAKVLSSCGDLTKPARGNIETRRRAREGHEIAWNDDEASDDDDDDEFETVTDDDDPAIADISAVEQCASLQLLLLEPLAAACGITTGSGEAVARRSTLDQAAAVPQRSAAIAQVSLSELQRIHTALVVVYNETVLVLHGSGEADDETDATVEDDDDDDDNGHEDDVGDSETNEAEAGSDDDHEESVGDDDAVEPEAMGGRSVSLGTTSSVGGGTGNSPFSAEDVASSVEGGGERQRSPAFRVHDLLNTAEGLIRRFLDVLFRSAKSSNATESRRRVLSLRWDACGFNTCTNRGSVRKALVLADAIELLLRHKERICRPGPEMKRWVVAYCRITLRQLYLRMALGSDYLQEALFYLRRLRTCGHFRCLVSLGATPNTFGQRSVVLVPLALQVRLLHLAGMQSSLMWMNSLRGLLCLLEDHPDMRLVTRIFRMLEQLGILQGDDDDEEESDDPHDDDE